MTEKEINTSVNDNPDLFDALPAINVSGNWEEELMSKINSPYKSETPEFYSRKMILSVVLILIINLVIALSVLNSGSKTTDERDDEYKVIEKELLSSPISLNN